MSLEKNHVSLQRLGLKPVLFQQWAAHETPTTPWRVRALDRGLCRLVSVAAQADGSTSEAFTQEEPRPAGHDVAWPVPFVTLDVPPPSVPLAVGDWVLIDDPVPETPRIVKVLQRVTWLRRASADGRSTEQLLASNLDWVFIVCAFAPTKKLQARALNARRIERFVTAVLEGGASPAVLVNKADLSTEAEEMHTELQQRLKTTPLLLVSALTGAGAEQLSAYLQPGDSVAFVGPSGVGKSTLINRLLGADRMRTGEVRALDAKGKHTTTRRELWTTREGAVLIDTPGMRQFAAADADETNAGFDDVAALAQGCRFTDCRHQNEPGCAVRQAIANGELSADRLNSYQTIEREALRTQARHDAYARHLQHKEYRRFAKQVAQSVKAKRQ